MSDWCVGIDFTKCDGRGLCAELLPERISLDDWGYPMVDRSPVAGALLRHVRRTVTACPALALFLEKAADSPS